MLTSRSLSILCPCEFQYLIYYKHYTYLFNVYRHLTEELNNQVHWFRESYKALIKNVIRPKNSHFIILILIKLWCSFTTRVTNSPILPRNACIRVNFLDPPISRIDLLFLLYISLKIKITKFKLYIIPTKYIPIYKLSLLSTVQV